MGKCGGLTTKSLAIIIVARIFGDAVSLLAFELWWWYHLTGACRGGLDSTHGVDRSLSQGRGSGGDEVEEDPHGVRGK